MDLTKEDARTAEGQDSYGCLMDVTDRTHPKSRALWPESCISITMLYAGDASRASKEGGESL